MSGDSLLIDTNIALYLLEGKDGIAELLDGRDIYLSFVTELELLGFGGLNQDEAAVIAELIDRCTVIDINQRIKQETIHIRSTRAVKLPDAIIAATAIYLNLPLLSADKGFAKIQDLAFLQYEV